jgi:hypothetical protein
MKIIVYLSKDLDNFWTLWHKKFHLDSLRKEARVRTIDLNKLFNKALRHALM